jgi:hypothetical protein
VLAAWFPYNDKHNSSHPKFAKGQEMIKFFVLDKLMKAYSLVCPALPCASRVFFCG